MAKDITDINNIEDQLRKFNEELEKQVSEKTLEIRESEEKYRTIIEQASDGIFIAGQDAFIIEANDCGCTMLGYTKEELQKMKFTQLVSPEDLRNNPIKYDELSSGNPVLNERRLVRKDGSEISVEISAKLLSDGRYQSIIRDITERKKTEAKLIEREEQLRLFVEHSPAALAMFDNDMRYIIASHRWMTDYNLGDQHLTGESHYEIFPGIPQHWKDIHQRCLGGAIEKNDDDSFTRADGSVDWVRWEIRPWHKSSGEVGGIIMFTEVITERKKAEEDLRISEMYLRGTLDSTDDGILTIDNNGKVINANNRFAELWHIPQELIGRKDDNALLEYVLDQLIDPEAFLSKVQELYHSDRTDFDILHFKDKRIFERYSNPLMLNNNIVGRVWSFRDITELKKAEVNQQLQFQELQQLYYLSVLVDREESIEKIYDHAMVSLLNGLKADRCAILLFDLDGVMRFKASQKLSYAYIKAAEGHSPWKPDTNNPVPIFVEDVTQEQSLEQLQQVILNEGIRSLGFIPLVYKERLIGKFMIYYNNVHIFNENEIQFAQTIAHNIVFSVERKRVEEEIEERATQLKMLSDNLPDTLMYQVVREPDGKMRFTYVSKIIEQLTGKAPEEVLQDPSILYNMIHEEDRQKILDAEEVSFRNMSVFNIEVRSYTASGEIRWLDIRSVPRKLADGRVIWDGVHTDITERKNAEEELKASYKAIRKLTSHLQNVREKERTHIAREIHDELGQQLSVLKMDVAWLNIKIGTTAEDIVKQKMQGLLNILDETVSTIRRIASDLRPSLLDDLGLVAAMEWQLGEFEKRSGIKTSLADPEEEVKLPDEIKTGLFRIFQESLTNVVRHAHARKVKVSLQHKDGSVVLLIADDGKGFEQHKIAYKKTLGLLGMKERTAMIGGDYNIISKPGKGTTVVVTVPLGNGNIIKSV